MYFCCCRRKEVEEECNALTEPLIGSSPAANTVTISPLAPTIEIIKASTVPFPKLGLKFSYLKKEFYDLCGGREKLIGKTTAEVNLLFQKEFTKSSKLSYCDFLNSQNNLAVGVTTVFISHA
jgi:hypothetical protein